VKKLKSTIGSKKTKFLFNTNPPKIERPYKTIPPNKIVLPFSPPIKRKRRDDNTTNR
jgi:hypothetical protein